MTLAASSEIAGIKGSNSSHSASLRSDGYAFRLVDLFISLPFWLGFSFRSSPSLYRLLRLNLTHSENERIAEKFCPGCEPGLFYEQIGLASHLSPAGLRPR